MPTFAVPTFGDVSATKQTNPDQPGSAKQNTANSSKVVNEEPPQDTTDAGRDLGIDTDSTTLLHDDPFSNETSKRLFDAIDELRKCGAGKILDLPQLVIVGQQSAGKSSLLRSLTDIPFSVGDGLCTRFATRIISRRTAPGTADVVSVSVEPGEIDPFGYQEDNGPTGNFNPAVPSLTADVFEKIVKQASDYMGIRPEDGFGRKNFSSKVLKIELAGPNRSHFGILDVPGIFRAKRTGVTDQEMKGVAKLVTSYMKKKENIIICVVPANNDLANQEIIDLALEHAGQSRILGVFTKCDTVPDSGIPKIVEIVRDNKEKPLQNGWFVVQNQQPGASDASDREKEEKATFSKELWLDIPPQQRGTAVLKKYLANTLCRRIREVFPSMKVTIGQLLAAERDILLQLGDARPSREDRHAHLRKIARRYQTLAFQALKAPEELPSDEMKLRGMVRTATEKFADVVRNEGHLFSFQDIEGDKDHVSLMPRLSTGNAGPLYREIRNQIRNNRGEELLGITNPKVLKPLFNKQTTKWQALGETHLRDVVSMSRDVSTRILNLVASEFGIPNHTKNELEDIISGFETRGENQVLKDLRLFCHDNSTRPLQTNNEAFIEKVQLAQHLRFKAALERYRQVHKTKDYLVSLHPTKDPQAYNEIREFVSSWAIVDVNDLDDLFEEMHPRGVQNTEDEIHDMLQAYYEVARTEYINHVTRQIVEPFLQDSNGPVLGLSVEYIHSLSPDQVDVLGSEDARDVATRERAEEKISELEAAMRIADHALRKTRDVEA